MKLVIFLALFAAFIFAGCNSKDESPLPNAALTIEFVHEVNHQPLYFDSLMYTNNAGEEYSVSKLSYYLSNFHFYFQQQLVFTADTVLYIDAKKNISINIAEAIAGNVDSISFFIGLDASWNVHGKIAATAENVAMEWPDAMGGGYHFIKLEGHWKDGMQTPGFAIHLGTNPYVVTAGCKADFGISATEQNKITMAMNVNEWFESPYRYSFSTDGVYTMGNAALMEKIKENGDDVIQIKP